MAFLLEDAGLSGWAVVCHTEQGQMVTVREAGNEVPFIEAVTVTANTPEAPATALTLNGAAEDPAGMVTDAGTSTDGLSADSDTMRPPPGAGVETVTVQVVPDCKVRLGGSQARLEMIPGASSVRLVI